MVRAIAGEPNGASCCGWELLQVHYVATGQTSHWWFVATPIFSLGWGSVGRPAFGLTHCT